VPFLNKPIPENEYRLLVTSGLSESTDTIAFLQAVLSTFNVLNLLRYENLTRYRRKLVQQQSAEHNRMIRIFEDANLKLSSVFSNIRGKTCTAVIDAVIDGETDPSRLSELCTHWRLKHSQEEIAEAVEGHFTEHHKFMIRTIRKSIRNIEDEIEVLDKEIDRRMQPLQGRIEQLCEVPGMQQSSIKELLAEIGVDMEVFPTAEHLTSWAGLAPGNKNIPILPGIVPLFAPVLVCSCPENIFLS
jgi:predicted transposase YbfD/YdcC